MNGNLVIEGEKGNLAISLRERELGYLGRERDWDDLAGERELGHVIEVRGRSSSAQNIHQRVYTGRPENLIYHFETI